MTYGNVVRKLSPKEALLLQGFSWNDFSDVANDGEIYRMAGNAVPRPMGAFAVESATFDGEIEINLSASQTFKSSGCLLDGRIYSIVHTVNLTTASLSDLLDLSSSDSLSPQAAAGLLTRLIKSDRRIPVKLFDLLYELSKVRTSLRGTKIDSFRILHDELNAAEYRSSIQC